MKYDNSLARLNVFSYNKREEDFANETDPLRAYNDYLEELETIGAVKNLDHFLVFRMRGYKIELKGHFPLWSLCPCWRSVHCFLEFVTPVSTFSNAPNVRVGKAIVMEIK